MEIKLKNEEIINLLNTNKSININDVDSKSLSIFMKYDQNGDKELSTEELYGLKLARNLNADMSGIGTKPNFHDDIKGLNQDNVINVIKSYNERYANSLIQDIACEYEFKGLSLEDRKKYILKIKNELFKNAKNQNIDLDLDSLSQKFDTELQKQTQTWGRMNTAKLDEIIDIVIQKIDAKKLQSYPEMKFQVATDEIFNANNKRGNANIGNIINEFAPNEIRQLTFDYEEKGRTAGVPNYTNKEFSESHRIQKRPASKWPQTMTQGIMNNENLSVEERKSLLFSIVDKACAYAEQCGLSANKIEDLKIKANNFIQNCPFESDSNSDMLNIYLDELFNKKGNSVTFRSDLREQIIRENQ